MCGIAGAYLPYFKPVKHTTMSRLTNHSQKRLTGRRIISVGGTYIMLDDGRKIYLEEAEIDHLNDQCEPIDNSINNLKNKSHENNNNSTPATL